MLLFRKFLDPQIAEPAKDNSIAHLMATQGVMNSSREMVATPISITENKEETKQATDSTPAETAISNPPPASNTSEPPQSTQEVTHVQEQTVQERAEQPSWQEVLKSQQPDTVFKELGFDDKMVKVVGQMKDLDPNVIGLIEAYKEGRHVDYLRELTTDYSKMSAEEVMRHQLRQDYPTASSQQLEALFKREVVKAYSLDSEDEDEKAEGQLLLEARADKNRAVLIGNQQKYLIPKFTEPQRQPEVDNSMEEDVKKFEVYRSQFNDNQYTKDIFANKTISIGEGDEKFTYKVDPNRIVKVLFNGEEWMSKMSEVRDNPDGSRSFSPNAKKQFLVGMVAEYGEDFLIEYAKHFKSLGGKSVVETIENAKPNETSTASASQKGYETAAEAMAKAGRMNYGG